jgi:hypothetical protein
MFSNRWPNALVLAVLLTIANPLASLAEDASVFAAVDGDPFVAFNVNSLKFHHPDCPSAIHCTRSCITIRRSDAIRRGGIPCKHCGGGLRIVSGAEDLGQQDDLLGFKLTDDSSGASIRA